MAVDNVIDELKVVVSLDPAKFEAGRKKVGASFDETKARARKTAEELESSGKQGAEFFDILTSKALRLGAVLLGGVGVKDFLQNTTQAGNAAGYMAQNIGIGVRELGRWQNVVRQMGGDVSQVATSFLGLSQALTDIQLHGKGSAELLEQFRFLQISPTLLKPEKLPELLTALHDSLSRLPAPIAFAVGSKIGLGPDLVNALRQTGPAYEALLKNADAAGTKTDQQVKAATDLTKAWGNFASFMNRVGAEFAGEIDPALANTIDLVTQLGESLDKVGHDYARSDLGALIGGLLGGAIGLPLGPAGVVAGAAAGVAIGGAMGADSAERNKAAAGKPAKTVTPQSLWQSLKDTAKSSIEAPGNQLPGSSPQAPTAQRSTAPVATYEPSSADARDLSLAAAVFNMIQQLEGGKAATVTPTGVANDPYAYGKNQITLGTAQRFDRTATAAKLLDAAYNDALAKKIQAEYIARYKGNLDAIAIAYHNGPDAADRFVANGGTTNGIAGFGPQSQAYLERERALVAASSTTNTTTSSATIGSIHVNAPKATDAASIAASIREELAANQLLSQGNAGPQ